MRRRTRRAIRATVPIRPDPSPARLPRALAGGRRGLCACLLGGLLLAGCAQDTTSTRAPGEDARRTLAEARSAGAIRTVVLGNPFGMDEARRDALVTAAMAEGVAGLDVRFTTYPDQAAAPEPHLVVVLNPAADLPAAAACRAPETLRTLPANESLSVLAAFCQGDEMLEAVREQERVAGPTDRNFERLLWRTSAALFPDDYWDNYGFGLLPRGIDLGIGGSFGF